MARRRFLAFGLGCLGVAWLALATALPASAAEPAGGTASQPPAAGETPDHPAPPNPEAILRGNGLKMTPEIQERIAQLLQLPKDKLWEELMKWPTFQQMTLQEQASFVNRLAEMRQRIRTQALKKAAELGLKIPPDQEEAFINSYLEQRVALERKIWQETQAKRRVLDEELKSNLKKQYAADPPPGH